MKPIIRTVTGDIDPAELGICYPHEHLLGAPPSPYAEQEPDLVLDNEDAALHDLQQLQTAGGQALVEMTPIDYQRNPTGLRRLSQLTGVHIICVTGFLKEKFSGPLIAHQSVATLTERFVTELTVGIGNTDIRAGVIKAASSLNEITAGEVKVFEAAAQAHRQTGALISTHTEAGTMALEQIDLLCAYGVPAERQLIGHIDRRLDWDVIQQVAATGVYMGFDQISKTKYYPDAQRIDIIKRLIAAGHQQQIMLSLDLARRSYLTGYGGQPGFAYLLVTFIPALRAAGVGDSVIADLLVHNAARALVMRNET